MHQTPSIIKPFATPTLTAVLLACAALLSACGDHGAAAATAPAAPTVGVLQLAPSTVRLTTELSGRTAAYQVAEVRPQVDGIVKSRLFTEGGDVKAGQALYQIDAAKYEADANSAKAALAKAQANLTTAALKAQRYGELAGIDAVSKQANDDAQAALKQAQADVASAQAALRTAQINLDYTRVNAPISGRIGRSSVTPGALVTANQATTLATIQQLDPIYVDVTQSSSELLRLQRALAAGQIKRSAQNQAKVKLLLEDGSAYPLDGKLEFSEVTVDASTGTVTLRATFPNPKHLLLPGMYVRAVVEEGESEQALLVPQKAVSRDAEGNATAMVLGDDGKVQARTLQAGRSVGDQWLVTAGLQAGDRVIVDGLQKVRPGAPAQADTTPAAAPASQAAPASAAH
jgi:membrane fusion protein (multidrug efflux system)